MQRFHTHRHHLMASLSAIGLLSLAAPAAVHAQPAKTLFDIEAGPLSAALLTFADQSKHQVFFDGESVRGRRAPALKGRYSAAEGLAHLLSHSDFDASQMRPGVFVIKPRLLTTAALDRTVNTDQAEVGPIRTVGDKGQPQTTVAAPAKPADPIELTELVVTGTQIRGRGLSPSPIVVVTREALDQSGKATVADYLSDLPQNYGGQASPDTQLLGTDGRSTNDSLAKGVNLRGLGTSATLVLVNGRRMGGAGLKGDFADLSSVPTAAVERVEVLLDGASAIYGSDAVGGVVNIILRRDFSGQESRVRYGGAQGGSDQFQLSHTLGGAWSSGHALLALEYQSDDPLAASKRPFTASMDLRQLGGTDHRQIYSHPGNILVFNAAAGGYVSAYAVPAGQSGSDLTPASFTPGSVNLQDLREGQQVAPAQDRQSLYLDFGQELGSRVTGRFDLRYTLRTLDFLTPASASVFNIGAATNPHFIPVGGATSSLIGYSFADELGPIRSHSRAQSLGTSAGLDIDLPHRWRGEVYGAYAEERGRRRTSNYLNNGFLNEALGNTSDNPATPFSAARDGYFNPYGDGGANSRAILGFIGSGYEDSWTRSQVTTASAKADGDVISLPGGALKAAIGVQARKERFLPRGRTRLSSAAITESGGEAFERTVKAAFIEMRAPLIGVENARPGLQRLELSAAARIEDYGDVGATTNPKLGLLWSPAEGLNLRSTYGTSFRAPALTELNAIAAIGATTLSNGSSQTLVILQYGGNRDLKPETAKSWTLGFDYSPAGVPGLSLNGSAFDVRFSNQIGRPVQENLAGALIDPSYAQFVTRVSPATNAADLARVQALVAQSTSSTVKLFPATSYGAIVDARVVNAAILQVRGLDLSGAYRFTRADNRFDLAASLTYLLDYRRKLTPTAKSVQLLNTAGQPIDLRGRVTGGWARGAWSANLSVNYADNYATVAGARIAAWTTTDLEMSWRPTQTSGALKGLTASISVQDLFDKDPPFYDAPQGVGYDPANADPLGRFAALQLTKRW